MLLKSVLLVIMSLYVLLCKVICILCAILQYSTKGQAPQTITLIVNLLLNHCKNTRLWEELSSQLCLLRKQLLTERHQEIL